MIPSVNKAYSKAAPALEQILADNPGIDVVIDLHRDGVGENTRLGHECEWNGHGKSNVF